MQRQTTKLFVSIAVCHFLSDCCSGVWPMFKYLAGLDLGRAGLIATASLIVGNALQPVFGLIVDRHGPRHLVLLGTACVSCAMLLGPLAVAGPSHKFGCFIVDPQGPVTEGLGVQLLQRDKILGIF